MISLAFAVWFVLVAVAAAKKIDDFVVVAAVVEVKFGHHIQPSSISSAAVVAAEKCVVAGD